MKDNYSWLDSLILELGHYDQFDIDHKHPDYLRERKILANQIEIEKLRARIEETTLWYKEWGNGKDRIGDGSWEDYYEYRLSHLTEKLKELESMRGRDG